MGKSKDSIWTDEVVDYLREIYPDYTNKEISKMLKEKFGIDVTKGMLQSAKIRYGFEHKKENPGCFKKGLTPWNKGRPMSSETWEKIKDTTFKKGNKTWNTRPVGSERVEVDGYVYVKIEEPNTWELKHRVVWEKHNGKLEEGVNVVFLDGNRQNCSIENLRAVSRRHCATMSKKQRWKVGEPEIVDASINLTMLESKIHQIKKGRDDERGKVENT